MPKSILIILTLAGFASGAEMEVTDRLSVDGSSLFKSTAVFSGDVGIGTTSPTSLLHVAGDANITGILSAGTFAASTVSVNGSITATGIQDTAKTTSMFMSTTTAAKTLDYMEYSTDANAQTAYISNAGYGNTGGTITTDGLYKIHTFTGSGTFAVMGRGNVEVLVVAGGGSGGRDDSCGSGGGGAGGLVYQASRAVTPGNYTVIIGNGGAAQTSPRVKGNNGNDSVFDTITAKGGGAGGVYNVNGDAGGSGGGSGGESVLTGGSATQGDAGGGTGFGNKGGDCSSTAYEATGGGGAGAAGANAFSTTPTAGGAGKEYSQFAGVGGSPAGFFAGGGGATSWPISPGSAGGAGGGGAGGKSVNGVSGTTNTGGGGGGALGGNSGAGGSGIVIVRYLASDFFALQSYSGSEKTQGSYSLKGIATTDALNKTLTRTVSPTIDLTGHSTLKFDIYAFRIGSNITLSVHDSGGITTSTTPYVTSINTWQTVAWDISKVLDGNKDAIDQIIITIADAGADNTFYIDNMYSPNNGNDILFTTVGSERMKIDTSGNVGIGTTVPGAKLEVNGEIKVGNSGATCGGTTAGSIRYNATNYSLEFCDGYNWVGVKQGPGQSCSTVNDVDGNTYHAVLIGTQCWMAENMRTTKYPNESSIIKGSTGTSGGWTADMGYYSCPPNTDNNGEDCAAAGGTTKLGMLYQWSAAMSSSTVEGVQGICPTGWHIPTDAEYKTLETYLGMCNGTGSAPNWCVDASGQWRGITEGDELKATGLCEGRTPCGSSGFSGLLGGWRNNDGGYYNRGTLALVWSSTQADNNTAWLRDLYSSYATVYRNTYPKADGFSVRCLKD